MGCSSGTCRGVRCDSNRLHRTGKTPGPRRQSGAKEAAGTIRRKPPRASASAGYR